LRQRAEDLGISNAEAARRAGLSERRYAHYVSGKREPDLATLARIAASLATTPNWLLAFDENTQSALLPRAQLKERLNAAANVMSEETLEILLIQAEAILSKK